jgi:hypothetical protein
MATSLERRSRTAVTPVERPLLLRAAIARGQDSGVAFGGACGEIIQALTGDDDVSIITAIVAVSVYHLRDKFMLLPFVWLPQPPRVRRAPSQDRP